MKIMISILSHIVFHCGHYWLWLIDVLMYEVSIYPIFIIFFAPIAIFFIILV